MVQMTYTRAEAIDAAAIEYLDELIAVGEIPDRYEVGRCLDCEARGMIRPSIFGEDFCYRCWNGGWGNDWAPFKPLAAYEQAT